MGIPATVADRVLAPVALTESIPRSPDPTPAVPTHNWYSVIPLPAVQIKAVEEPCNTLPGAGLVSAAWVLFPEPPPLPLPPLPLPPLLPLAPVPVRLIVTVSPVEALLLIVTVPVKLPAVAGSKPTEIAMDCPGFNVAGTLAPETVNPVPEIEIPLIVNAAFPDDVRVTEAGAAAVLRETVPNPTEFALRARAGALFVTLAVNRKV